MGDETSERRPWEARLWEPRRREASTAVEGGGGRWSGRRRWEEVTGWKMKEKNGWSGKRHLVLKCFVYIVTLGFM
ncbi:hypothetical protein Scep_006997 [Stephania cephalantha]|uniref:Uncharacterized protein n=1 Tax=Stephania cephalantha TaxID=152367 RepID=A0AAP0PNF1_9MAGN